MVQAVQLDRRAGNTPPKSPNKRIARDVTEFFPSSPEKKARTAASIFRRFFEEEEGTTANNAENAFTENFQQESQFQMCKAMDGIDEGVKACSEERLEELKLSMWNSGEGVEDVEAMIREKCRQGSRKMSANAPCMPLRRSLTRKIINANTTHGVEEKVTPDSEKIASVTNAP